MADITSNLPVSITDGTETASVNASNYLEVAITQDDVGIGGGTQYTEDAAAPSDPVGNAIMMSRDDALSTVTEAEGDWSRARGTAEGALWTQDFNSDAILADTTTIAGAVSGSEMQVDIVSGNVTNAGTFAVQVDGDALTALQLIDDAVYVDDADWTDSTSKHLLVGGLYQSTEQSITDGDVGPLSVDANGRLKISIEADNAGIGGGTQYAEDSAHSSGNTGTMALVVRNDTLAALAGTDGDYAPLQVNASGALYIQEGSALDVSAATVTVDLGSNNDVIQSTHDNFNANANIQIADTDVSATNPVPVAVIGDVLGTEKHSHDEQASLSASGTDNHDVSVTASTTYRLHRVHASASGKMKITVQAGPVAGLVTQGIYFTSSSNPSIDIVYDPPIEVDDASTGTIRVIRENLESAAMDVHSTIMGQEIAD